MATQILYYIKFFLLLSFFPLLLVNCSIFYQPGKIADSLSNYAESVFKRQNLLTQKLMLLSDEDISLADGDKLSEAEYQMYDDCRLLNQYAMREMEGKTMSLWFRKQVKSSIKGCEISVITVESILLGID